MSLQPFLDAPAHIQVHAAAATLAAILGPIPLYRKRRDGLHKTLGYVWVLAMATVAISAFFIHSFAVIGPFSPLHLFAILTLGSLWFGIKFARQGDIRRHQVVFRNLYWFGLWIAGLANFLPGRTSNEAAFGGADHLGWVMIALGGAVILVQALRAAAPAQGGGLTHVV